MALLDGMIKTGRLCEFVEEFISIHNEEEEDKVLYEVWLHKVFDKDFVEFRDANKASKTKAAPTQEDISETVRGSKELLNSFNPLCGGANGTISSAGNNSG